MIDKEKLTNEVIKRAVEYYFNGINVLEAIENAIGDLNMDKEIIP
ncbi:hypothetical protein [Clostridium celatum]|nr:hypothetical protein [Clostridium celatum]